MKKLFFYLALICFVAIVPGCKEEDDQTQMLCSNGVLDKDNNEDEIDCGGPCEECPPAGTVVAKVNTTPFEGEEVGGIQSGVGMRIYATGKGVIMQFIFNDLTLNQPQALNIGQLTYGDPHMMQPGDTGTVVVTAIDTTRRIISGTFSYSSTWYGSSRKDYVNEGVFTNVRYKKQ